jgi:methyl-accepting chemotaxis protein
MPIDFLYKGVLVAATLCVVPAALPASPKAGQPGARSVAANTAASPKVTSSLLEQIRIEAISVENNADQLQMLVRDGSLTGREDGAPLLEDIGDHVNEMNKLLSYLRVHQAEASPLQQKIIEQVAAPSLELAGTTQCAVVTLNNNEAHLYLSDLAGLANDMFKEASRVDQTVGNLDKYLHARHEEQQLKQALALTGKS